MTKKMISLLIVMIIFSIALSDELWHNQTLYDEPNYVYGWAYGTEIKVDSYNRFHIAHNHQVGISNGELMYTYYDGTNWSTETFEQGTSTAIDISLDSEDNPHFAFKEWGGLGYRYFNGIEWIYEYVIDFENDYYIYDYLAMDMDSNNIPHIICKLNILGIGNRLMYSTKIGGEWVTEEVLTRDYIGDVEIVVDNDNTPHIAFTDQTTENVVYGKLIDNNWEIDDIVTTTRLAFTIAIQINQDGQPDIIYNDSDGNGQYDILHNIYFNGSIWEDEEILYDTNNWYYSNISYLIDEFGSKRISYSYGNIVSIIQLWYGEKDLSGIWNFEMVNDEGRVGRYSSVGIKSNGNPVISYGAETELKPLMFSEFEDFDSLHDITFNITDSDLAPLITLEGYGDGIAVNGTLTFENIPYTTYPGLSYSIELEDYYTIEDIVIVDENENIEIEMISSNGINDDYELRITNYELKQNYPNPFNPTTKINYELLISNYEFAEIVVHNSSGQKVWSSGNLPFTIHHSPLLFDGSKFNSGIYYYSLIVDNKAVSTKSMLLIK